MQPRTDRRKYLRVDPNRLTEYAHYTQLYAQYTQEKNTRNPNEGCEAACMAGWELLESERKAVLAANEAQARGPTEQH